jgi:hypothetical protein
MSNKNRFIDHLISIKRARLIEHHMTYEDLELCENFSPEEITL